MFKAYCVIFLGLLETRETFNSRMSKLGVSTSNIERMIRKAPIILKADMTLPEAKRYAGAVREAGGRVSLQDQISHGGQRGARNHPHIEPFESFTMCPECGFKQLRAETCVKCGFPLEVRTAKQGVNYDRGC